MGRRGGQAQALLAAVLAVLVLAVQELVAQELVELADQLVVLLVV